MSSAPPQLTELCVITKKDEETIRNYIGGRDRNGAPMKRHAWLWRALLRGVAVHHPAMKLEYRWGRERRSLSVVGRGGWGAIVFTQSRLCPCRKAVEYFFRMKRLSLVFATDTLGQGINMPCRRCVWLLVYLCRSLSDPPPGRTATHAPPLLLCVPPVSCSSATPRPWTRRSSSR